MTGRIRQSAMKRIWAAYDKWGPFLESPETFWAHFGWNNSLCMFKTKASPGTKLWSCFNFYSQYKIWKDQLYTMSGLEFYEWLFGFEKISGLSRKGPLVILPDQGQFRRKQLSVRQNWRVPFTVNWLIKWAKSDK